jgi:hypothetical protein
VRNRTEDRHQRFSPGIKEDGMRFVWLMVVLAVVALVAAPALAQDMPGQGDPGKRIEGNVSAVDQQNKTVDVSGMTLHVTDKTQISGPGMKPSDLASLKEGDRVRASYSHKAGQDVADRIDIVAPGGAMAPGGGGGGMQQPSAPRGGSSGGGGGY